MRKLLVTLLCLIAPTLLCADSLDLHRANIVSPVGADSGLELSLDFLSRVSLGLVPGVTKVNKFGHNRAATSGEDVWGGGGLYEFYPVTAQPVEIVSTDADDTDGGTGVWSVTVLGLDENWRVQSETVSMNGLTAVDLQHTYLRLYRAFAEHVGSSKVNEGAITVKIDGAGTTALYIGVSDGQTQQAIFTTPANTSTLFLKGYVGVSDDDKNGEVAEFQWIARANNGSSWAWNVKGEMGLNNIGSSNWQYLYGVPSGPVPGKTDIRINTIATTAELGVVGGFDLLIFDNDIWGL